MPATVTVDSALATVGVLFGSAASLVTIVPYGIARSGTPLADTDPDMYAAIVAVAVVLTLAARVGATGRALRAPAVAAVAG